MDRKIIVSTILDENFAAAFPKLKMQIYSNFEELIETVSSTPIRTDKLYITEDVVRHNPSSSFTSLVELVSSVFFKADEIVFIVPFDSTNIERINFLVKEGSLSNVNIIKGELQKEFLLSVLRGDAENVRQTVKRKEVIRHRRSEFIKNNRNKPVFGEKEVVHTEEERLFDIEDQKVPENDILPIIRNGRLIQITGLNDTTRSVFAVILSQFAAGYGKTVFFDTDMVYFTASYLFKQGNIKCETIPIKLFYTDPLDMIKKIRESEKNLICITGTSEDKDEHYQVFAVVNAVFSVLKKEIDYFIFETNLEFVLPSFKTIAVIENDIISAISTAHHIPPAANMMFASVDRAIEGMAVYDSDILSAVVSEILDKDVKIPIYSIKSLNLEGGESFDLHRYVKGEA